MMTFNREHGHCAPDGVHSNCPIAGARCVLEQQRHGAVLIYPTTRSTDSHGNGFITALTSSTRPSGQGREGAFSRRQGWPGRARFQPVPIAPTTCGRPLLPAQRDRTTLVTFDNSCTVPPIRKPGGVAFSNSIHAGDRPRPRGPYPEG